MRSKHGFHGLIQDYMDLIQDDMDLIQDDTEVKIAG
jgi:hypothetical protein